ncbi:MAG: hypothetical protein ACLVEV_02750 [Lachnospiraceae bacterium]|uniref:hypothetical protein n=1 Tax=Parablautia sp. Marseille-Q6255 TaxID=3039593 RepID=UPI0024BCC65B|nr:hypothetical protein [Parablautia sp. Marseille-Q6255]
MKKLLCITLLALLFLSGCQKNPTKIASAQLFIMDGETTAAGVAPGDGPEEFISAYKDYEIQAAYLDQASSYLVMSIDEIPYEDRISTLIATLFIDGEPVSEEAFCEENDVTLAQLPDLISSRSYLRRHDVIYRYLDFKWEDNVITDIYSGELNYNETYEAPHIY